MYLEFSDWELGNMSLYLQWEITAYPLPYLPGGPKSILKSVPFGFNGVGFAVCGWLTMSVTSLTPSEAYPGYTRVREP
jgi:hypothetical protein